MPGVRRRGRRAQVDAHAAVPQVFANLRADHRLRVEQDAIVPLDAADGSRDADERGYVVGPEAE